MTQRSKPSEKPPAKSANGGAVSKPVAHADNSGHMDPAHAARLLRLSRETATRDVDVGFVARPRSKDATAEQLGEEAVAAMTGGDSVAEENRDERAEEEDGGPFVVTSGTQEFAAGTDESNIPEATREPFPKTSAGG